MEQKQGNEIIIYQPDQTLRLDVRVEDESVWLTQAQMAELFNATKQNISLHIRNIYKEGELERSATVKEYLTVQIEGGREIKRKISFYNLDVIISVGYRVKSFRGTQFRQWANKVLKEYLLRGYTVNARLLHMETRIDHRLAEHDKRKPGVKATVHTMKIDKVLRLDIKRHNEQYPPIIVTITPNIHDRFLIIDDTMFHIGASIKDLGKKLFAFSKMETSPSVILNNLKDLSK